MELSKLPDRSKWCSILKCSKAAGGSSRITFLERTRDVTLSDTARSMSLDSAVTRLKPKCTETKFGSRESAVAGIRRILLSRNSKVCRLVKPSNASSST